MKIFIDTNIFLDLLLERDHANAAKKIIEDVCNGLYEGYVADITLINIDYIAKKQTVNINRFLEYINNHFIIVGAQNDDVKAALETENNDFEDSIQLQLAKKSFSQVIITNDSHFVQSTIPTTSSAEFTS